MIAESQNPPVVLIVDDDPSIRKSLQRLMRIHGYAAKAFSSADDFLEACLKESPSCLVLDIRMPGMDGIELQKELKTLSDRDLPVIFITGHGDVPTSVKAMKEGAVDFLPKPFEEEALLSAIRKAIRKSGEALARKARVSEITSRLKALTARECEVFRLVVAGLLNKQIGGELHIAEKTVKIHRARVMQKMQACSLADLVRISQWAGVVEPPETVRPEL